MWLNIECASRPQTASNIVQLCSSYFAIGRREEAAYRSLRCKNRPFNARALGPKWPVLLWTRHHLRQLACASTADDIRAVVQWQMAARPRAHVSALQAPHLNCRRLDNAGSTDQGNSLPAGEESLNAELRQ
jgi:hypothetical protein